MPRLLRKKIVIPIILLAVLLIPFAAHINTTHKDNNLNKDAAVYIKDIASVQPTTTPRLLCEDSQTSGFMGDTSAHYRAYYEVPDQNGYSWLETNLAKNNFVTNSAGLQTPVTDSFANNYIKNVNKNFAVQISLQIYTAEEIVPSAYRCNKKASFLLSRYRVPPGKLVLSFGVSYK